jgi:hypothetical protein
LLTLLAETPAWRGTRLTVDRIQAATNRVLVEIGHPGVAQEPAQLVLQERAGWIIATLARRGWLDAVRAEQRETFGQAVRGLYHWAGVDLVWEQVVERFGPNVTWYDVNAEGLLLWPDGRYAAAELYRLRDTSAGAFWTPPSFHVTEVPPTMRDEVFFSRSRLTWDAWVRMWDDGVQDALSGGLPTASPEPPTAGHPQA